MDSSCATSSTDQRDGVGLRQANGGAEKAKSSKSKGCKKKTPATDKEDFGPHSTAFSYAGLRINLVGETAVYSKKVFIGGLPHDITDKEILSTFQEFGAMKICWPKKDNDSTERVSKGYCFITFENETSVRNLVQFAKKQEDSYYLYISSPAAKFSNRKVHVRPWKLSDSEYFSDGSTPIEERKTVYVYGVPRPLTAGKLASEMEERFGEVIFAGLDIDSREKYPLCQARVSFKAESGYLQALKAGSIQLQKKGYSPSQIQAYVSECPWMLCSECSYNNPSPSLEPILENTEEKPQSLF